MCGIVATVREILDGSACSSGWKIDGPDCYLLVDVAMTYDDAVEMCEKYVCFYYDVYFFSASRV